MRVMHASGDVDTPRCLHAPNRDHSRIRIRPRILDPGPGNPDDRGVALVIVTKLLRQLLVKNGGRKGGGAGLNSWLNSLAMGRGRPESPLCLSFSSQRTAQALWCVAQKGHLAQCLILPRPTPYRFNCVIVLQNCWSAVVLVPGRARDPDITQYADRHNNTGISHLALLVIRTLVATRTADTAKAKNRPPLPNSYRTS